MKKSLYLIFTIFQLSNLCFAQNDRPDYSTMAFMELSKKLTSDGYMSIDGSVFREGGTFKLKKGTMPNRSFAFAYESPTGVFSSTKANDKKYLGSEYSNKEYKIKNLQPIGSKSKGYVVYIIFGVGGGKMTNYWLEIDNAVDTGEIEANFQTKTETTTITSATNQKKVENTSTKNSNSTADELLKYKQLLDAGLMTKAEFEAQKKKLLSSNDDSSVKTTAIKENSTSPQKPNVDTPQILDSDFEIGSIVTWKDFGSDIWYGEVSKLKDSQATIKTSHRGKDLTKSMNVKYLTKITSIPNLDISKYRKEAILNINSGDKVELSAKLEKVSGIYIGIRGPEDNVIVGIQSSDKGKPTISEFSLKDYTIMKSVPRK